MLVSKRLRTARAGARHNPRSTTNEHPQPSNYIAGIKASALEATARAGVSRKSPEHTNKPPKPRNKTARAGVSHKSPEHTNKPPQPRVYTAGITASALEATATAGESRTSHKIPEQTNQSRYPSDAPTHPLRSGISHYTPGQTNKSPSPSDAPKHQLKSRHNPFSLQTNQPVSLTKRCSKHQLNAGQAVRLQSKPISLSTHATRLLVSKRPALETTTRAGASHKPLEQTNKPLPPRDYTAGIKATCPRGESLSRRKP